MYIPMVLAVVLATVASAAIFFCLFFLFVLAMSRKAEEQRRKDNVVIGSMMADLDLLSYDVELRETTAEGTEFQRDIRKKFRDLFDVSAQENPSVREQAISKHWDDMQSFRDRHAELMGQGIVGS